MIPLNFAILKLFTDGRTACAEEVIEALRPQYESFKALNTKDVLNALMTAESNALLEEAGCDLGDQGEVRLYFRATPESIRTINSYIRQSIPDHP